MGSSAKVMGGAATAAAAARPCLCSFSSAVAQPTAATQGRLCNAFPARRAAARICFPNGPGNECGDTSWCLTRVSTSPAESARRRITRLRAASRPQYNAPQGPETVPVWLWICLALYRTMMDAVQFLWEQPGQLKHIEWPSLQSTIKMAALTVVVVALLIIFLATIDSTFSYVLSSILRRVPS